jgi:lysyl-tRNA synthetase class 1
MSLAVPQSINEVLAAFDARPDTFETREVADALQAARDELTAPTADQNKGAWAEVLAFNLTPSHGEGSEWGTYFGPIGSWTKADGTPFYSPDIAEADAEILEHWKSRATSLKHPILQARYSDLVWDFARKLAGRGVSSDFAKLAIGAYIAASQDRARKLLYAIKDAQRALSLAISVKDHPRVDGARTGLLSLHTVAMKSGRRPLAVYDALVADRRTRLTAPERDGLVADLEALLVRLSDTDGTEFEPHGTQDVAERLLKHYGRAGSKPDAVRLHRIVANTFEHVATLGDAMLASAMLQTSMDAYKAAGDRDDAERVRRMMAVKVRESHDQMATFSHEIVITAEDRDKFLAAIVVASGPETLIHVAIEFLLRRARIEKAIQEQRESAPLLAMISQTIMGDDHVVATVGSIEDDPHGRLLRQALWQVNFWTNWLSWALKHAIEVHKLTAQHFVAWANRGALFGDGQLLRQGIEAWLAGDHTKAVHVLLPQIEAALRGLIGRQGHATTKPHPVFKTAQVAIGMGDIIYNKAAIASLGALGDDVALHFAAIYADPRGMNLRNKFAHGLMPADAMHEGTTLWIVHSLLLLGALAEPVQNAAPSDIKTG